MQKALKRIMAGILSVVLIMLTVGSVPMDSHAETTLEKLQKAKEEKNKTEDAKKNTQQQMNNLQIKQDSLLGQLSSLNDDLAQVSDNLDQIEARIVDKQAEIEQTRLELDEAIRIEEEQYERMKIRVKFMYERGTKAFLDILLTSSSFADFLNKSDYIEEVSKYDKRMLEKFQETREYTAQVKAQLETELGELEELQHETEIEQQKVSAMVKETANSVAVYADQIADAEDTINTLDDMLSKQNEDIAALQKQYEKELELSRLAAQSAWRDISEVQFEEGDRYLLANLIYCEAGGEPYAGQVAVGAVVINRVLSSRYPNTVVGVIYQNRQFSPVASGRLALALANNKATANCYKAADEAMSGITNVGQCVYFRTPIPGLNGISIGGHIFY